MVQLSKQSSYQLHGEVHKERWIVLGLGWVGLGYGLEMEMGMEIGMEVG
jgi:hypothetical protein